MSFCFCWKRPIALVTMVFFTWMSIQPWNFASAAVNSTQHKVSLTKTPTIATVHFEQILQALKQDIAKLDHQIDANENGC